MPVKSDFYYLLQVNVPKSIINGKKAALSTSMGSNSKDREKSNTQSQDASVSHYDEEDEEGALEEGDDFVLENPFAANASPAVKRLPSHLYEVKFFLIN